MKVKENEDGKLNNPYLMLFLGILLLSFSPLFTHWADAPGIVTSFYRMFISVIALLPFSGKILRVNSQKNKPQLQIQYIIFPILAGIFSALDHSFWGSSIKQTNVANATLLNYISPIWVSIVSIMVFREKYKKYYWIGLFFVFIGSMSVLNIMNSDLDFNFRGEGFAIISSFFYAGYFLLTQKGRNYFTALQQLLISLFSSCLILLMIMIVLKHNFFGYSQTTYIIFFLSAIFSQLFGYYCLTQALGEIPASIVSPSLTLQPVVTALLAIPFAQQKLSVIQIFGGIGVLVGIVMINKAKIQS